MKFTSILTLLLFTACASAPPGITVPTSAPVAITPTAKTEELGLGPVVAKLSSDTSKLNIQYGWLCQQAAPVALPSGRTPLSAQELERDFRAVLSPLGYRLEAEPDSVFATKMAAGLRLGATLTIVRTDACLPFTGSASLNFGSTSQVKGTTFVEVAWEIYSAAEGRVVLKKITQGSFETKDSIPGGIYTLVLKAWTASLKNLAAEREFTDAVLKEHSREKQTDNSRAQT